MPPPPSIGSSGLSPLDLIPFRPSTPMPADVPRFVGPRPETEAPGGHRSGPSLNGPRPDHTQTTSRFVLAMGSGTVSVIGAKKYPRNAEGVARRPAARRTAASIPWRFGAVTTGEVARPAHRSLANRTR